jgi:hypothetical protein
MPYDPNLVIEMTQVDPGDLSDIPPDLPAGAWMGPLTIKCTKTGENSKSPNMPMLIVEATAEECETPGNEDFAGGKTADFFTILPANHPNSKFGKIRFKQLCEAYELPMPDASSLAEDPPNFSSMADWIEQVESEARRFYTTVDTDKRSGEKRTRLHFSEPGQKLARTTEEDDVPAAKKPAAKTAKAAPAKKTNGAAKRR